jgi:hypothetical protein
MCLIIFVCLFLLYFHIEYIAFLILLLYLGGVLIFFLFITLMINKEYTSSKFSSTFSFENLFLFLFFIKSFFLLSYFNCNIYILLQNYYFFSYYPTYIENNYNYNLFLTNKDDAFFLLGLYTEKFFCFLYLGFIFLYGMMGAVLIMYHKNV